MSSIYLEIEDLLQEKEVFISGINGRPTHSDSYMTILSYKALDNAWKEISNKYNKTTWENVSNYWISQGYLTPTLYLLGKQIKRHIEKDFETI